MAAVTAGAGVPTGGSIGSTTYGRNRFGTYVRNRTIPVNPNSDRQNARRANFRNAVNSWTTSLTAAQRQGWETYAQQVPWPLSSGEIGFLTGQNMYIRYYSAWGAALTSPPASLVAPVINNLGFLDVSPQDAVLAAGVIDSTLTTVVAANTWAAAGGRLFCEVTPGQNPSRSFPGSRWALAGVITGAATGTHVLSFALASLPFSIAVGQAIWYRFRGLAVTGDNRLTVQQIRGPLVVSA